MLSMIWKVLICMIFIRKILAQQSSVQIQKIEADPPNPNVGEGLKIRCFLINVDPFAQYPTQVLWSIRRFSMYSKMNFPKRRKKQRTFVVFRQVKIVIFVYWPMVVRFEIR